MSQKEAAANEFQSHIQCAKETKANSNARLNFSAAPPVVQEQRSFQKIVR